MASVFFDPQVGGNGTTVSDDSSPTTGLVAGGHRQRFVPSLAQIVAIGRYIVDFVNQRKAEISALVSGISGSEAAAASSAASALSSKDRVEIIYSELQGGGDVTTQFIRFNPHTITEDITFPVGMNGMSSGDMATAEGVTITISEGSTYTTL